MLHSRKDTWSVQTRNLSDSIPHGGEQPLEAIGVGWGALAIRDDPCTPLPNGSMTRGEQNHGEQLELPGEEWPNLQKVTESVRPMPMDGNHKSRNLNRTISSWEVTNQQRQQIKLGAELKQHLFSFPNQQFEKELNELDEASKRLEEAMGRVSQVDGVVQGLMRLVRRNRLKTVLNLIGQWAFLMPICTTIPTSPLCHVGYGYPRPVLYRV
jgi:hypothetical protein